MKAQNDAILAALQKGETLTAMRAVEEFGCLRLAARVHDIRTQGHLVASTTRVLPNGKRIAEYRLAY